ncbi:LCP family protein [Alicyclobacillus macrosporangiidus]|uniref:Cell envelope-related function transcriptional attenuator common domain-containing protein n=1 Tax=Alicyclobacillus macrosporangiidus TaxID=392015 RepID=A0A1I7G689_9BACL|nr:LCP family protein [Alicyclobacillus macrosporangiidus]SFU43967.1 cell envelope-related function transcriptional attenuator common domain-containing protein [Alicyclobacillus macrosporangiidus]
MTNSKNHPDTPDDHAVPIPPSDAAGAEARVASQADSARPAGAVGPADPADSANSADPAGPAIPGTRRRRRRAWWIGGAAALACVVGAGVYAYVRLQPAHHFTKGAVPVVAKPANTSGSIPPAPPVPHDGTFNLLLLGIDARAQDEASRTDSIVLVHVDLPKHDYEVLSIPRDTRVNLPGYGETKITHANYLAELKGGEAAGIQATLQAVSDLTGLTINYYAETDYWGLQDIVDAVGGITMDVPVDVKLTHPWYPEDQGKVIPKGEHFLDGKMVTEIVHERYSLPDGEFDRQRLQEAALVGIAKQVLQPGNVTKIPALVGTLSQYLVTTNLSQSDMLSLALGVKDFEAGQVHYYQVPGRGAMMMDPVVKQQLWYWIPDLQGLKDILQAHFTN